jgi:hypothetical protein
LVRKRGDEAGGGSAEVDSDERERPDERDEHDPDDDLDEEFELSVEVPHEDRRNKRAGIVLIQIDR